MTGEGPLFEGEDMEVKRRSQASNQGSVQSLVLVPNYPHQPSLLGSFLKHQLEDVLEVDRVKHRRVRKYGVGVIVQTATKKITKIIHKDYLHVNNQKLVHYKETKKDSPSLTLTASHMFSPAAKDDPLEIPPSAGTRGVIKLFIEGYETDRVVCATECNTYVTWKKCTGNWHLDKTKKIINSKHTFRT